jgi:KDO2-lipid IV(A) lauroyltransferase
MSRPVTRWRRLQFAAETLLVRGLLALLRRLGPVRASNFGGAVARAIGPKLPVSRVAERNLRLAMPELDAAARKRVIRGVWDNLGRTAAELPHVAGFGPSESGPGWEAVGDGFVPAMAVRPGPILFLSGHIGNWEILPAFAATYGIRLATFYRAAANPDVDRIIVGLRRAVVGESVPQFAKGAPGARGALAFLRGGGRLGMLVDQKMNDGIAVPFFGHSAMTAPAAAAFALRFRCPVVIAFVQRIGPARFRVVCVPPLDLPETGDRQVDIATLTAEINRRLEGWIRVHPESWLWLHRRWPKEAMPVL